jgi:hypothetical protein
LRLENLLQQLLKLRSAGFIALSFNFFASLCGD